MQERLKKEYKSANKTREGYIDDSDEEEKPKMSKEERRMQKLIRNREGGDPDDSDDENKNPYASSVSFCILLDHVVFIQSATGRVF